MNEQYLLLKERNSLELLEIEGVGFKHTEIGQRN